jgi:hypothetical protein
MGVRHEVRITQFMLAFCMGTPAVCIATIGASSADPNGSPLTVLSVLAGLILAVSMSSLGEVEGAATRASLCVKAGWLRLALGETEAALGIFTTAHTDLLHMIGPNQVRDSWVVAAGQARALCEAARYDEAVALRVRVDSVVDKNTRGCRARLDPDNRGRWKQQGPLLRAGMAAAVRAPDSEVLALLTKSADEGCWVPAGSWARDNVGSTNGNLPEWDEFLNRMAHTDLESAELAGPELWHTYRDKTIEKARKAVASSSNRLNAMLTSRGLDEDVEGDDQSTRRARVMKSLFEHPAWAFEVQPEFGSCTD